jgi:hypothetical protein
MKKYCKIVDRAIAWLLPLMPLFFSGCGRIATNFAEPRAVPAPLNRNVGLSVITADTALNILQNSLLESIMLLIAVILFIRYRALAKKNQHFSEQQKEKHNNKNFIDYKSSFDYSNWHFNEEERKN